MSWLTTITGGATGVYAAAKALISAGMSSGAIQAIAAGVVYITGQAKGASSRKNILLAAADLVDFEPSKGNIDDLVNAIARLTYVLEQEMKARKEAEDAKKQQ